MCLLRPDRLYRRVENILPEELAAAGVRALLLDVDNTLLPPGESHAAEPPPLPPSVAAWLAAVEAAGIALTVVSNGRARRIRPLLARWGLSGVAMACKPLPLGFWRAARRLSLPRRECLVIGDQTFTDVLGARAGGFPVWQTLPLVRESAGLMGWRRRREVRVLRGMGIQGEEDRRQKTE